MLIYLSILLINNLQLYFNLLLAVPLKIRITLHLVVSQNYLYMFCIPGSPIIVLNYILCI